MGRLTLTLLGDFQARLGLGPPLRLKRRKTEALLAYCALPPGQRHSRDKLAALLWGDRSPPRARSRLRETLFVLRRALATADPPCLELGSETLALTADAVDVDAVAFERLMRTGGPEALARAVELYHGDLLEGLAFRGASFENWLMSERERLRELALDALAKLLAHQRSTGTAEAALPTALRLTDLDPLQEAGHRTLMRLYVQVGRRGAALRQYQLCVEALKRELNVEPEPETRQLYREILRRRAAGHNKTSTKPRQSRPPDATESRVFVPTGDRPLIGRETESARLHTALEAAVRRQPQIIVAVGEAGIGKTSLLGPLAAEATGHCARILLGRCYESASILPFGPWVDAFRRCNILEDETLLEALSPVWRSELARLLPELGRSDLPVASDDQLRLFESVARLVGLVAARGPVLLVLEDVHWADEMSLRLLAFIARRGERWPMLVVVTAREEDLADAPAARRILRELMEHGHAESLPVAPLSRQETVLLTRSLARVGDEATALAQLEDSVWRSSEGNPFVAVETIRAVQETSGRGTLISAVPQRVHELIAGRLERLSDGARRLASVAAVIGEEFEFSLLQRAADLDAESTAAGVEELVRRRILHGTGEHLDFIHDRIRSVLYAQILPPHRRHLHRRVAETLEVLYEANLDARHLALGLHFREGGVWEKAVTFLRCAGAAAAARCASREAVACFERALDALTNIPESSQTTRQAIDLRLDLQSGYILLGDLGRMNQCLHEAEILATRLGDEPRLARVWCHLVACAWWTGALDSAIDYGRRALSLARKLADVPLQILSRARLSLALMARGNYGEAIAIIEDNLAALSGDLGTERFGMASLPAVTDRSYLGLCRASVGDFREAATADQAIEIAVSADHPYSVAMAYFGAGRWRAARGDFDEAIPWLERALDGCRRQGFYAFSVIAAWAGLASAHVASAAEGVALLEDSLAHEEALNFMPDRARTLTFLGEAYLLAGRTGDALRAGQQALGVSRMTGQRQYEAMALRLIGDVQSHCHQPDAIEAEQAFWQALALAEALCLQPLIARCRLGLGMLYRATGRSSEARQELSSAGDLLRSMGMTFWLRRADVELESL